MRTIDLNADLGEECGDDDALLRIVTTANVAAGGHAGGGAVLRATVRRAAEGDVRVGAHPSYPDRAAFGRVSRADALTTTALVDSVAEQVAAVADACRDSGIPLALVKAHGALYNDAVVRADVCDAILAGVSAAGGDRVPVVGLPGSMLERVCRERDVPFVAEAYADRAYAPDGSLVPRGIDGAVLHDADAVAERVLRLVTEGWVAAIDGTPVRIDAQTVCVHGDTPGAVRMAALIRERLAAAGVDLAAVDLP